MQSNRDCIKSAGRFGEYCYLNNIQSSDLQIEDVFPFLKIFFNSFQLPNYHSGSFQNTSFALALLNLFLSIYSC